MKTKININNLSLLLATSLFVAVAIQGLSVYKIWQLSNQVSLGNSQEVTHRIMGEPVQQWAKASNLDIWHFQWFIGELRVDILYSGEGCNWQYRHQASQKCKVKRVHKRYQTIQGNNWFLSFAASSPHKNKNYE